MSEGFEEVQLINSENDQEDEVMTTNQPTTSSLTEVTEVESVVESSELHLPKVSYPLLRIPWGVMALEKMGLCRCGGKLKWRRRTYKILVLFLTFVIYASYHLSRVAVGVVKSTWLPECRRNLSQEEGICSNQNLTNSTFCPEGWEPFLGPEGATKLGSIDTAFLITYAISQFLSGIIAERTPLRYFLSIGMLGATVCTSLLGFAFFWRVHYLWYFILVQIIGGIFQASGWPPLVAIMGNWFSKTRRGLITGLWNWHTAGGNLFGYLIPAIWANPDSWGWSFLSAAFIMLSINIVTFLFLPTEPQVVGLKPPEKSKKVKNPSTNNEVGEDNSTLTEVNTEKSKSKKAIPIWRAFLIPCVLEYSFCLFFSKLVSYGFLFWLPFYVKNTKIGGVCLGDYQSVVLAALFNVGFMVASVLIGGISDLINSRSIASVIFFTLCIPSLFLYRAFGHVGLGASGVLILLVGIFVNGPYSIVSTAVAIDLGNHKTLKSNQKAVSTVGGIIDGTGSIGAAIGPFLIGWIDDNHGWDSVFYFLMICCFLAALAIIRIVLRDVIKGIKYVKQKNLWRHAAPEVYVQLSEEDRSDSHPVATDTYDDSVTGAGARKPVANEETTL